MKKIFILLCLLSVNLAVWARDWQPITSQKPAKAKTEIINPEIGNTHLHFTLPGFYLRSVQTPQGVAQIVEVPGLTPILEAGTPDLPKMATSLLIPDVAGMKVEVTTLGFTDYPNLLIAPSKGVIIRDTDPATVPYTFGDTYTRNADFPGTMYNLREPHIIRDFRGQTLLFHPFQYNPVTKVLRVYHDVTIRFVQSSETGQNPITNITTSKKADQAVLPVLKRHFQNFDAISYTPVEEYGNLLVICHGPFMAAMQPYVDWKRASGYPTEMVSTDSTGTNATQIKEFIAEYYNTKGLTHVLLVGDKAQIPTNNGSGLGGPSDNAYGYIVGSDHYADVFIGRFSAENDDHVQIQVQRTLDYEINPQFLTDDWYTTVIGIASNQGPGDDNEMDYQHIRNQQTQLLDYTYTKNPELFDGSQGGNDAPGNPTPPMVATEVNDGAGLILYTGHGSDNAWSTSGFSNNNVNQLTNVGKWPFIWSVACVNGNFVNGTCFAEAWLRAHQGSEPTGAIAFLGSTINQSWDSPMEGQDEMTDILAESYPDNIKRTFAGISISGCMKMIDSYGNDGRNMADTWTVFGDPTVMVRTAAPTELLVNHDTLLFTGDSTLLLLTSDTGARATITLGDTILATGVFQGDSLLMTFPALSNPMDTLHLVVTSYNHIPYIRDIAVDELVILPVTAYFTSSVQRVIPGETVTFTDTSAGTRTSWEWSFPGGTPETSSEQNPVITYSGRGVYDVSLIVGNGLTFDTLVKTEYITCDFAIGQEQKELNDRLTITPNPSDGLFSISLEAGTSSIATAELTNMAGAHVFSATLHRQGQNFTESIDLRSIAKGIYFLKVNTDETRIVRKIIIR